ncbi:MAG TPA: TraM recognition domain-containing protein [bacterium]|nr:TraM recognition domain-containing protein [bacterium]
MDFGQEQLNYETVAPFETSLGAPTFQPIYLIIGGIFILLIITFIILRRFLLIRSVTDHVVYCVKLPKERLDDRDHQAYAVQELREEIAKGEGLFTAIGGLKAQRGLSYWLRGRNDHFAFEIVAHNKVIAFYVVAPREHQTYLEHQLSAIYPEAVIEEVHDYNIFTPHGTIVAATVRTKADNILPLKTYQKDDADPLNSIINAMSKVGDQEGLAIQYIVRSARGDWHSRARRVVHKAHESGSLSQALGSGFTQSALSMANSLGQTKPNSHPETNPTQKKLTPKEEEMLTGIEEKNSKAGVDVNLRIVASAVTETRARSMLQEVAGSFSQYNYYEYGNSLKVSVLRHPDGVVGDFIFRRFNEHDRFILNTEEMASLYHLPLKNAETPNILWLTARQAAAPVNLPTEGLLLGTNMFRGVTQEVKIKPVDRLRHTYIIGKSGVGKSFLLANMAIQDILAGHGICMIDPHGDLIDDVLRRIPENRADDVIIFAPSDIERPVSINLLEFDPRYPEQKTFVINEMIGIFDKLYDLKATGGPIFEQYMRNAMLLIMSDPESGSTLMEIPKVLADASFRNLKLSRCSDPTVVDFWRKEAEKAGGDAALANVVPYVTSKLTSFISNDMMRPIIGQQKSSFNLRDIMDSSKILLVSLPKGIVGELNAYLLGMIIVGKILMAALSRADLASADRKDFYLYIDEFQNFTTDSVCQILSEARKYGLGLIMAHQYIGQLTKKGDNAIKEAVFGNVGTIMSFKVGSEDAEFLKKEFSPVFNEYDLMNIEKYTAYVKLLIDNSTSRPFSMKTPWPLAGEERDDMPGKLKHLSRMKYGEPREKVEAAILERSKIN